jgi:hypothetical protein
MSAAPFTDVLPSAGVIDTTCSGTLGTWLAVLPPLWPAACAALAF